MKDGVPSENSEVGINFAFGSKVKTKSWFIPAQMNFHECTDMIWYVYHMLSSSSSFSPPVLLRFFFVYMLAPCGDRLMSWWGPDSNKMLKPDLKAYIGMLALWSMEIIYRNILKWKVKEEKDHGHSQQINLNNFTVSQTQPFGSREGKTYPILTAISSSLSSWCVRAIHNDFRPDYSTGWPYNPTICLKIGYTESIIVYKIAVCKLKTCELPLLFLRVSYRAV